MDAESVILNATRQYLRLKGWYVMRIQQSIGCHPGISDLIAVKRGMTIFVETKSPKWRGKLSKDQEKFKAEIEAHGGMFYVIDSKRKWWRNTCNSSATKVINRLLNCVLHLNSGQLRIIIRNITKRKTEHLIAIFTGKYFNENIVAKYCSNGA